MTDSPELADQVADAVRAVPGVHDLYGGVLGEVATYLPGRRVVGVRLTDDGCDVHIVTTGRQPLAEVAPAVRAAVRPVVPGRIDVTVEDVAG